MPTPVSLIAASLLSAGFFAFGLYSIVRPHRVSRFFRTIGKHSYPPRLAARLFAAPLVRFIGVIFVIGVPFIAWSAFTQILD